MTSSPTVYAVAERARVSPSTVSRAFSRPELVSDKTRQAVLQAAKELNFTISRSPMALKSGQTFRIALLTNTPVTTWFGANVFDGLDEVFHPAGYDIAFHRIDGMESREDFFDTLPVRRNVDAVVVTSFDIDYKEISRLKTIQVPIAGINTVSHNGMSAWSSIDDHHGLSLIVKHLALLGHREIMFLGRNPKSLLKFSTSRRLQGMKDTCEQLGVKPAVHAVPEGDRHLQTTFNELVNMPVLPTAIACQEDGIAIPLICKLRDFGLRIPEDISVTGFDDSVYAEEFGLTTIRQQPRAMGNEVARKILKLIRRKEVTDPFNLHPAELIVRTSTAPPRA